MTRLGVANALKSRPKPPPAAKAVGFKWLVFLAAGSAWLERMQQPRRLGWRHDAHPLVIAAQAVQMLIA
jgi:hypothetical protein